MGSQIDFVIQAIEDMRDTDDIRILITELAYDAYLSATMKYASSQPNEYDVKKDFSYFIGKDNPHG
jgi:hypothetical protein